MLAVADRVLLEPQRVADREYTAGIAFFEQQRFDAAADAFRSACATAPTHRLARLKSAQSLHRAGQAEAAVRELERLLAGGPRDAQALNTLGLAYAQLGRSNDALRTWRSAQQADPLDPDAYVNVAYAAASAGQPAGAERMLLRAVECGFGDMDALSQNSAFRRLLERGQLSRVQKLLSQLAAPQRK